MVRFPGIVEKNVRRGVAVTLICTPLAPGPTGLCARDCVPGQSAVLRGDDGQGHGPDG
jgi:hypothetical protein